MNGIKWLRGSSKKNTTRVPKSPKQLPSTKPKVIKPHIPGVWKPKVKLPFIHGEGCSCGMHRSAGVAGVNYSAAGINAILSIREKNHLTITRIKWELSGDRGKKVGDDGRVDSDALYDCPEKVCSDLANSGRGEWWSDGADVFDSFMQRAATEFGRTHGYGLWALSHINCSCKARFTLTDMYGESFVYLVAADAMQLQGDGPDAKYKERDNFLGYSLVQGDANKVSDIDNARAEELKTLTVSISPNDSALEIEQKVHDRYVNRERYDYTYNYFMGDIGGGRSEETEDEDDLYAASVGATPPTGHIPQEPNTDIEAPSNEETGDEAEELRKKKMYDSMFENEDDREKRDIFNGASAEIETGAPGV